ncbi:MAG: hypothetical protein IT579_23325 [Verrucomicrobia subdivision 3 bacterium]|nr:hypothetical protein [Verrucomicrobiota bacterium]MCC6823664.1 hypothetical protein [Limisphaerales bacterium]
MPNLTGRNGLVTGAASNCGVSAGVVMAVLEAGGRPLINERDAARLAPAGANQPATLPVRVHREQMCEPMSVLVGAAP